MAVNSSFFHIVGEHNVEHIMELTKFLKNLRENNFLRKEFYYKIDFKK